VKTQEMTQLGISNYPYEQPEKYGKADEWEAAIVKGIKRQYKYDGEKQNIQEGQHLE